MPVHDCTVCAAVATCALLKMGTSSEHNPIKARIAAIRELTQANPNFIQQFDSPEREALIKEHMQASRQISPLPSIPEAHTDTQAQESSPLPIVHEQEARAKKAPTAKKKPRSTRPRNVSPQTERIPKQIRNSEEKQKNIIKKYQYQNQLIKPILNYLIKN